MPKLPFTLNAPLVYDKVGMYVPLIDHVIIGGGLPLAMHMKLVFARSFTVVLDVCVDSFGEAAEKMPSKPTYLPSTTQGHQLQEKLNSLS